MLALPTAAHRFALVVVLAASACNAAPTGTSSGPTLLWSQHFVSLGSEVATDGYRVFVMGTQRAVGAFKWDSGDLLWTASTTQGDTIHPSSLGSTGRLGCIVGSSLVVCNDLDIVAFGNVDGSYRWRSSLPLLSCSTTCQPVTIADSSVYVFTLGGTLTALSQRTGLPRWTSGAAQLTASIDTGIVVLGSSIAASPTTVTALSVGSGATRWSTGLPASARLITGTALWQSVVLASASDGYVYGLDRINGSILWKAAGADTVALAHEIVPCVSGTLVQPMLVMGNSLFVETSGGVMAMIDLPTHTLLHRVTSGLGPHLGVPLVTDSSAVYVIGLNGDVAAFSLTDAHLMQAYSVGPDKICAIALGKDRLFAIGESGLYAISKAFTP